MTILLRVNINVIPFQTEAKINYKTHAILMYFNII